MKFQRSSYLAGLLLIFAVAGAHSGPEAKINFDDLFPRRPFTGKLPSAVSWSYDDRYLAYLWNPYKDHGMDVWIYDTQTGKSAPATSIEGMRSFDRDIPKTLEFFQKEDTELDKADKMSDLDYREWVLRRKEEAEKRKEPEPSYGISEFEWAKKSDEMLFAYKGDIYRLKVGEPKPVRLTSTQEAESNLEYSADDKGFYFRRGDGVFYMSFDSPYVRQLNPELPNRMPLFGYSISPDGSRMAIYTGRQIAQDRTVDYLSYRNRFAEAQKAAREVADDKFNSESYIYLYDLNDDPEANPKNDGKPWEIWKFPGGADFMEYSVNEKPWSPDSKQFVFTSWKRTPKELTVWTADVETKTLNAVYKGTNDGEHRTPSLSAPFFTPDGKHVILLLENSGYRQSWSIDTASKTATQVTKGDFETYPEAVSKDGKTLFVRSGKDSPAQMALYKVDMATGEYTRFSSQKGSYGDPVLSHNQDKAAVVFESWTKLRELYVADMSKPSPDQVVTNSHREGFDKINVQQPQVFTYKNRHGDTIYGFMFAPKDLKKTKHPLMIYVYGGPLGNSKSVTDGAFNSTAYWFNMYLCQKYGFVTVTIDPHGQTGYGSDFGRANFGQPGKAQVEDLSDGVKYLVDNFNVDPKKVAVNGWSFGGFQTQMCMYTAPDVFTLGIAGAGPTEWQNYNNWYSGGVIGKVEDLDKYSLTYLAKNLRSPLMLLHGMEDTNVLFQDTVKVYRKLLQYGKGDLVELALDPTGGHGMGGDMSTRDRHAIYLGFIKRWWRLD